MKRSCKNLRQIDSHNSDSAYHHRRRENNCCKDREQPCPEPYPEPAVIIMAALHPKSRDSTTHARGACHPGPGRRAEPPTEPTGHRLQNAVSWALRLSRTADSGTFRAEASGFSSWGFSGFWGCRVSALTMSVCHSMYVCMYVCMYIYIYNYS